MLLLVLALVLVLLPWASRQLYPLPDPDLIAGEALSRGLDPWLVAAVIRVESRFDPTARSHRGAIGLMQVMPDTALWVAERLGLEPPTPADLTDPALNVHIGTWYLADLVQEFGEIHIALAAYNAGRGTVARWLAEGRLGRGPDPGLAAAPIPFPETENFVRRVLRDWRRYRRLYPRLHGGGV